MDSDENRQSCRQSSIVFHSDPLVTFKRARDLVCNWVGLRVVIQGGEGDGLPVLTGLIKTWGNSPTRGGCF